MSKISIKKKPIPITIFPISSAVNIKFILGISLAITTILFYFLAPIFIEFIVNSIS